jgi:hypothetical protein
MKGFIRSLNAAGAQDDPHWSAAPGYMPSWSLRAFRPGFRESFARANEGDIGDFLPAHRSVDRVVFRGGSSVGSLVARIGLDEADGVVPYENGSLRLNELESTLATRQVRTVFNRVGDSDLFHGFGDTSAVCIGMGIADVCDEHGEYIAPNKAQFDRRLPLCEFESF